MLSAYFPLEMRRKINTALSICMYVHIQERIHAWGREIRILYDQCRDLYFSDHRNLSRCWPQSSGGLLSPVLDICPPALFAPHPGDSASGLGRRGSRSASGWVFTTSSRLWSGFILRKPWACSTSSRHS